MNLRIFKNAFLLLLIIMLLGCANNQAFTKAKMTFEQGDTKAGLQQLKKLVGENPENLEYKNFYYKQREATVHKLLQNADNARVNEHWEDAEGIYNNVLEIDEANSRAQDGLRATAVENTMGAKLNEASDLLNDDQTEAAKEKVRQVLNEQPTNLKAKKMYAAIEKKLRENNGYYSKVLSKFKTPVSLELKDAYVKTVFELISKAAGVNFVLDKEIKPDARVSIFVKHTTIDDALKNILASTQLSKKILNENTVLVYPNSKKSEYEEIMVKTFYLTNVEPKKAEELIKTVVKTKDIFVDEKLNILVMRDTYDAIRSAEKLINSYDIGDPEVLLEVEVLEISNTLASELGLRWPNQLSVGIKGAAGNGQLRFDEVNNFKSNMARLSITDPTLVLTLRGTEGGSNLLANPHIRVKNHKKAKVHIGDRVPVITNTSTSTGFVSESVSYLDVGLKLDVEPSIMINDEVSIDVGLEVSNIVSEVVTKSGSLSYRLGTRNATTTLRLKDGETQVLAGLINNEERISADRVPGLASLPIIGRLFSSKNKSNNKTEIVLLITPKIIRNISPTESSLAEFSLGTESGNSPAGMSSSNTNLVGQQNDNLQTTETQSNVNSENVLTPAPLMPIPLDIPPPPPLPAALPAMAQ
ncbi:MAG: general secretion pathway protein GspD [Methylotenera sp.]|uniref:secretin and TonB N-terminal domain-containing protein n=1 Tax=Methylotenera sp. TaxID=2051956 RepID=UPI0018194287|nr:secretin and TonB N-terminal domain-containing protein [Methylotenera sp.]NOU25005.1 general secretion pathway protein GspD [Methylotenera sp.]